VSAVHLEGVELVAGSISKAHVIGKDDVKDNLIIAVDQFSASKNGVFNVEAFTTPATVDKGLVSDIPVEENHRDGRRVQGSIHSHHTVISPVFFTESDFLAGHEISGGNGDSSLIGNSEDSVSKVVNFGVAVEQSGLVEKTFKEAANPGNKDVSLLGVSPTLNQELNSSFFLALIELGDTHTVNGANRDTGNDVVLEVFGVFGVLDESVKDTSFVSALVTTAFENEGSANLFLGVYKSEGSEEEGCKNKKRERF